MIYLQLFLSFLQIGLFSFGGGYAAMPLIQDQVVTAHGWLSMPEFTDLITISHLCGNENRGSAGSCCGDSGMRFSLLRYRYAAGAAVFKISGYVPSSRNFGLASPGGGGHGGCGRNFDLDHRFLGR